MTPMKNIQRSVELGGGMCRVSLGRSWPPTLVLLLSLCVIPSLELSDSGTPFATDFYLTSFNASSNSLTYLRDAFVDNDRVFLTSKEVPTPTESFLVPLSHGIGRVLYATPIRGRDEHTGEPTSFSTTFVFSIINPQQPQIGDGLAFLISTNNSVVGSGGAFLGVLDQSSNGSPSAHTFAVEFDTWQNPSLLDPDGNHVGVDVNSMISQKASTAGFWTEDNVFHLIPLTGLKLQAWIDYSGETREIQVSISPFLGSRPPRPLLALKINLTDVMEDTMFVGFAAATGDLSAEHVVYSWSFNTTGPARAFSFSTSEDSNKQLLVLALCIGAASFTVVLIAIAVWTVYRRHAHCRQQSSKVHIGDPEAVVLPADLIRDAARIQADLNISKVLAETHMRAFTEGR